MFSILSLFTEDVKLRHETHGNVNRAERKSSVSTPADQEMNFELGSPRSHFADLRSNFYNGPRAKSSQSTLKDLPFIPLLNAPEDAGENRSSSVHPGIVARANIDTTIAVIPAEVNLPCAPFGT